MNRLGIALVALVVVYAVGVGDCYALFGKKKAKAATEQATQEIKADSTEAAQTAIAPEKKQTTTAAPAKTPEKAKTQAALSPDQEKQRAMREQKRAQLNNSQWPAELLAMSGEGKKHKDTLLFKDNRFSSETYAKQGFAATNYTLSVQEDGSMVWETMQTAENGQLVFWRGEISSDMKSMRGVVSKQKAAGESEDYSFVCSEKSIIAQ
jgi:hypothetical protein